MSIIRDIIALHRQLADMPIDEHLTNINQIKARSRSLMDQWNTVMKKINRQNTTTRYLVLAGTRDLAMAAAARLNLRQGSWKHLMRLEDLAGCRGHQVIFAEEFYADEELNSHIKDLIDSGYLETYRD
jgi:hypothetical protein